jgi:hypothetical protein
VLDPQYNYTMQPTSGYILKAYATRAYRQENGPVKNTVRFYMTRLPLPEKFVPKRQTGEEYQSISRETIMTPAAWKAKVAAGDYFQFEAAKLEEDENGVFILTKKTTPCI